MSDGQISDMHSIVRHVGGSKIDDGIVNPEAFMGQDLSVHWLECAQGTKDEQLDRIRSLIRRKLGTTAKLAELEVGKARNLAATIDVVKNELDAEDGWPDAPCHAEIVGIPEDDCEMKRISEALADSVIELHPSKPKLV